MRIRKYHILVITAFASLFVAIFSGYIMSHVWDYDFWWHLSTGRYIVQNFSLPEEDPFSFPSQLEENKNIHPERESFILKQYWLAQAIFYLIYNSYGDKGIIIFRAVFMICILLLLVWGMHRRGVKPHFIFLFLFLIHLELGGFTGERPVLFTILLSLITLLILDDTARKRGWTLLWLSPVMLLWSNLHGGFVLGVAMLAAFLLGETIKKLTGKMEYSWLDIRKLYLSGLLAAAVSTINPNTVTAFFITFSSKYNLFTDGIQEYRSPLYLQWNGLSTVGYPLWVLFGLFPFVLALRRKKMDISYLLILAGLWYSGMTSIRFSIYYAVVGAVIMAVELNKWAESFFQQNMSEKGRQALVAVFSVAMLISAATFALSRDYAKPRFGKAEWISVPKGGVDFLDAHNIPGNMFNEYGSGGYLSWRLYPKKRIFIDTRGLNYILMTEYGFIWSAQYSLKSPERPADADPSKSELWERLLDHYNINIVFLTPADVYGSTPPLLYRLIENEKWVPVYNDQLSIIFVRNAWQNRSLIDKFRKNKEDILNTVVLYTSLKAGRSRANPYVFVSLGDAFYKLGKLEDALKAYNYAYTNRPEEGTRAKIAKVEDEIKAKKNNI